MTTRGISSLANGRRGWFHDYPTLPIFSKGFLTLPKGNKASPAISGECNRSLCGDSRRDGAFMHDTIINAIREQTDLICTQCPLERCDEDSLFCAFRWATNPNRKQLAVATVRLIPQRLTGAERSRRWRQKNPARYAEVRRDYNERKRNAKSSAA